MVTGTSQVRARLITTGEAAILLGVSSQTMRVWVAGGHMPAASYVRMPSGRIKFHREAVEAIRAGALNGEPR